MVADALSRKTIYVLSLKYCTWRFIVDKALLAQLRVMLELQQMLIDTQKDDVKLQERVQLVSNGDKTDYYINDDGGLNYKSILCVPNIQEVKKKS